MPSNLTLHNSRSNQGYSETIANGLTGAAVYIQDEMQSVSVGIIPAGGASGKAQYTLSPGSAVEAGTATWRDWPAGVVAATTDDTLIGPVTAVRGVSAAGNVTIEIVG